MTDNQDSKMTSDCKAGWMPIDTAPRDGETVIDLWCEGLDEDGWLMRGSLHIGEPQWLKTEDGGDYFPHENGGYFTHWMPLPPPPNND